MESWRSGGTPAALFELRLAPAECWTLAWLRDMGKQKHICNIWNISLNLVVVIRTCLRQLPCYVHSSALDVFLLHRRQGVSFFFFRFGIEKLLSVVPALYCQLRCALNCNSDPCSSRIRSTQGPFFFGVVFCCCGWDEEQDGWSFGTSEKTFLQKRLNATEKHGSQILRVLGQNFFLHR